MNLAEIKKMETIQNTDNIFSISPQGIHKLIQSAEENVRKRIRINMHLDLSDGVHEMIIVHKKGNYVRPHQHPKKSESFHMISGELLVLIFNNEGKLTQVIPMAPFGNNKDYAFCYRSSPGTWHSIHILSDYVVFHETTNGPFDQQSSQQAPFAPDELDVGNVKLYLEKISADLLRFPY
jgi:cupin fold WbuC family metalloprotein